MAALNVPWLSACSPRWLRCALLFATALVTVQCSEGIQAGPFAGAKSLTLVTCTVVNPDKQGTRLHEITLTAKTPSSSSLLVTINVKSGECNVQDVLATCTLGDEGASASGVGTGGTPYSVSVVMPEFNKGEAARNFTCQAKFDSNGDTSSQLYEYHQIKKDEPITVTATPKPTPETGSADWISTRSLQGEEHIGLVECRRPKENLLSVRLFANDTQRNLGSINYFGKSCTTAASVFTSCHFHDADDDVILKTLVSDLQEGETTAVGCQAFQRVGTPESAYVRVTFKASSNSGVSRVAGGDGLTLTVVATWVVAAVTQLYQN